MLFDLRARGRRRTVQAVYLGLAVLIGGGLVLFGVGTGSGFGGLLNAFTNGSSGSSQPAVSQAEKSAVRQTRLHPSSPGAWSQLVQARIAAANQQCNGTACTAAGRKDIEEASQAWQRYLKLTPHPDSALAQTMAHSYESIGDFQSATKAWMIVTQANSTTAPYFEFLAQDAYRAKETRVGDLAAQRALALTPKAQQKALRQELQQLKSAATAASSASGG
jgi:tetratricopeptide (TPR) repeat protein